MKLNKPSSILPLFIFVIVIFSLCRNPLYGINERQLEKHIKGLLSINERILGDTFVPVSFTRAGDTYIQVTPVFMDITHVSKLYGDRDDVAIAGDDLNAYALNINMFHARGDWLFFFVTLTGSVINGKTKTAHQHPVDPNVVEYVPFVESKGYFTTEGTAKSYLGSLGMGWDFQISNKWSVSEMVGLHFYQVDTDFSFHSVSRYHPEEMEIEGSAYGGGFIFSVAFSYRFSVLGELFKVSPYFFATYGGLLSGITATVTKNRVYYTNTSISTVDTVGNTYELQPQFHGRVIPGVKLEYDSGKAWSFTLSISGYMGYINNYYNDIFFSGMEMKLISITASYKF